MKAYWTQFAGTVTIPSVVKDGTANFLLPMELGTFLASAVDRQKTITTW
jgi:hypothetical protein